VRPNAKENGQIRQSNAARTVGNVGEPFSPSRGFQSVQKTPTIHISHGSVPQHQVIRTKASMESKSDAEWAGMYRKPWLSIIRVAAE
jgi:hypothetical protein